MTDSAPPTGHPGAEILSAHLEGLLHPSEAAPVEAHVAGCTACRGRRAGLADVRVALASLDVDRMPRAVAGRLEAALLAERTAQPGAQPAADGVEPAAGSTGHHRDRRPAWLLAGGVAAALTGLVLVGAPWDATTSRDDDTGAATRSTHEVTASGTTYTSADLEDQVHRLLSGDGAAQADSRGEAATSGEAAEESSAGASPGGTPTAPTPPALDACIDRLAGGAGGQPLAIDTGTFAGSPATVIVLPEPGDAGSVVVWVVGPTCPADDALLYHHRMPR